MKKMVVGVSLALAILGFLMSPAMAAAGPPPNAPALSAFLASLAVPAAAHGPKHPANHWNKALCNATANCAFGGTVSCQGNSSSTSCTAVDGNCSWGIVGYVICDGYYSSCPGSCCPGDFCSHEDRCAASCYPCSYSYTCNYGSCSDDCECQYSTCPI
ncbi:MAG TPA: hypothetical protein VF173_30400 [Thermoanaerobaculia bacterium]|nr:hypothetical protein [Thermoanaerobaculia bacterium]